MKKRLALLLASFLLVCLALALFLGRFLNADGGPQYPEWTEAAVLSADGSAQPFDPAAPPAPEAGTRFLFRLALPAHRERQTYLLLDCGAEKLTLRLDGQEIFSSSALLPAGTANLGQLVLPLPMGGGETLELELEIRAALANETIFPPLLRLTEDPADAAGTIAYANSYALPTGASALLLVLL